MKHTSGDPSSYEKGSLSSGSTVDSKICPSPSAQSLDRIYKAEKTTLPPHAG